MKRRMPNQTDMEFVLKMDERFPGRGIRAQFTRYSTMRTKMRPGKAKSDLRQLPRSGPARMDFPSDVRQSVGQHHEALRAVIKLVLKRHSASLNISESKALFMADNHDTPEVLTSDFNVMDNISKKDKSRLEELAARTIFRSSPRARDAWREYEDNRTSTSKFVHEADKLECALFTLFAEEKHPGLAERIGDEFWGTSGNYLKTSVFKNEFEKLLTAREEVARGITDTSSEIYNEMRKFYESQDMNASRFRNKGNVVELRPSSIPPPPGPDQRKLG